MDFVELGAHCSLPFCKQQDFLPFKCDGCNLNFCLAHRCYKSHNCPTVPKGIQVILCPICSKGIEIINDTDLNRLWEMHYNSSQCRRINSREICASQKCKKILSEINSVYCRKCEQRVCLAHRYSDQHKCKEEDKIKCVCI